MKGLVDGTATVCLPKPREGYEYRIVQNHKHEWYVMTGDRPESIDNAKVAELPTTFCCICEEKPPWAADLARGPMPIPPPVPEGPPPGKVQEW